MNMIIRIQPGAGAPSDNPTREEAEAAFRTIIRGTHMEVAEPPKYEPLIYMAATFMPVPVKSSFAQLNFFSATRTTAKSNQTAPRDSAGRISRLRT